MHLRVPCFGIAGPARSVRRGTQAKADLMLVKMKRPRLTGSHRRAAAARHPQSWYTSPEE